MRTARSSVSFLAYIPIVVLHGDHQTRTHFLHSYLYHRKPIPRLALSRFTTMKEWWVVRFCGRMGNIRSKLVLYCVVYCEVVDPSHMSNCKTLRRYMHCNSKSMSFSSSSGDQSIIIFNEAPFLVESYLHPFIDNFTDRY